MSEYKVSLTFDNNNKKKTITKLRHWSDFRPIIIEIQGPALSLTVTKLRKQKD